MGRRNIPQAIGAVIGMGILILDNQSAIDCVTEGIQLCIHAVIPALFPFFVLSSILVSSCDGNLLLAGLLGGYPVGAKTVSEAYIGGRLSKTEAERLLPICNQCGPAFIFGMTATLFQDVRICFALWGIQLLSVLLMAWIIPKGTATHLSTVEPHPISWSEALHKAIRAIASVCGWIILFRLLIRFLQRWFLWYLPLSYQVTISGLLELTNGCTALHQITDDRLRFAICVSIICFGGICVTMQSFSVMHDELNRFKYFLGKLLQVSLAIILTSLLQMRIYTATVIACPMLIGCILYFRKKSVAFSDKMIYNDSIKDTRKLLCFSEKRWPAPAFTAPEEHR